MTKKERILLKEEKMLLKLLYRKGFLDEYDFNTLGWASYIKTGRYRKRRSNRRKYSFYKYTPKLYHFWVDYWGEGDEASVVDTQLQKIRYNLSKNFCKYGYPLDKFSTEDFVKYLRGLPNKYSDGRINNLLKVKFD